MEFGSRGYSRALTIAVYVGMLTGAIFWGLSADMIGRRFAFNVSLFICSAATIVAGAMPSWPSLGFFVALLGFGAGGNCEFIRLLISFTPWVPTGEEQLLLSVQRAWALFLEERWQEHEICVSGYRESD